MDVCSSRKRHPTSAATRRSLAAGVSCYLEKPLHWPPASFQAAAWWNAHQCRLPLHLFFSSLVGPTLFSTAASHFDTKEGAVLASVVAISLHICSGSLDLLQYDIGIFAGFDGFESQRSQHNFWVDTIFVPFFFFMS